MDFPAIPQSAEFQENYDRFFPFLLEIRRRLFFVVAIFILAAGLGFVYYEKIIRIVLAVFRLQGVNIVFTSPFQFMNLAVSSGLLAGIITVLPLFIYQLLSFLKPALNKKEYKTIVSLIPLSLILFIGGFGFGSAMMRYVVELFYARSLALDIGNFLDISKLLSQILMTAALMGVAFQFPIVITLLMKLNIVKYSTFAQQRMIAYATSILFAALLPPTDVLSLIALTAPLLLLFEATLIMNKYILKTNFT